MALMKKSVKVGLFVLMGIVLTGIATFMIGESWMMWDKKLSYRAAFNDVSGLKAGAPVRMGGVDVGNVTDVSHAHDMADPRIYVTIAVKKSEAGRIRTDTRAQILNKGLLGDKMVDLSTDGKGGPLDVNGILATDEPLDFTSKLSTIANKAENAVSNVERATQAIGDPKFKENLGASLEDVRVILDGVARRDTAAHRFLLDPSEGPKIDRVLANLEASTQRLDAVLANVQDVANQVKSGPGIAHALVYDGEMSAHASGSLAEVHKDLEQVRTGHGLAHEVLYGEADSKHVMANIDAMTDDLRAIVHDMRAGKGTLGALLVDPSVYEDLKGLVGNVERNDVLRALVRYSIKADEKAPPPPRVEPR